MCSNCGLSYCRKSSLVTHMISKHPEIPRDSMKMEKSKTVGAHKRQEKHEEGRKKRKRGPNRKSLFGASSAAASQPGEQDQHRIPAKPVAANPVISDNAYFRFQSHLQQPLSQPPHPYFNYSAPDILSRPVTARMNFPQFGYAEQIQDPGPGQIQPYQICQQEHYLPSPELDERYIGLVFVRLYNLVSNQWYCSI